MVIRAGGSRIVDQEESLSRFKLITDLVVMESDAGQPLHFADVLTTVDLDAGVMSERGTSVNMIIQMEDVETGEPREDEEELLLTPHRLISNSTEDQHVNAYGQTEVKAYGHKVVKPLKNIVDLAYEISGKGRAEMTSDEFWTLIQNMSTDDVGPHWQEGGGESLERRDVASHQAHGPQQRQDKEIFDEYFRLRFRELGIAGDTYKMNAVRYHSGLDNVGVLEQGIEGWDSTETAIQRHQDFLEALVNDPRVVSITIEKGVGQDPSVLTRHISSRVSLPSAAYTAMPTLNNRDYFTVNFGRGMEATLQMTPSIYISIIKNAMYAPDARDTGRANAAMAAIADAADRTDSVVTGYPAAFGNMPQGQLIRWYGANGYEPVLLHMVADQLWHGGGDAHLSWHGWRHPSTEERVWEAGKPFVNEEGQALWGWEGRVPPPQMKAMRPRYEEPKQNSGPQHSDILTDNVSNVINLEAWGKLTEEQKKKVGRFKDGVWKGAMKRYDNGDLYPKQMETRTAYLKRLSDQGITPYYAAQTRTLDDLKVTIPEAERLFQTAGYRRGRSMARTMEGKNFMQLDPDRVGPVSSILEGIGSDQVSADLQRLWDEVISEMPLWQGKDGKTQFEEANSALKDEYGFKLPNGWEKKFPTAGDFLIGSTALRDEFRYWYERYVTASRQYLDLTDHEWDVFNKVLAATSQRTNVKDNMERTLSIMSEIFGNRFGSTDVISDQSIRNALNGQLGSEDQLKTGSFNATFEFIAGRGANVPLSTNDAIMAKVFGLPGNAFADSFWYETISRYMIKMSGYLNSKQGGELEPYQPWQLQALMWVNRDDDRASQTYVQTLESFIERAIEAGVMKPGEKIRPEHLADPEMSDIARSGKHSHFHRTPRGIYTLKGSEYRPVQRANMLRNLLRWGASHLAVPERMRTAMANRIANGYDAAWRAFSKKISGSQPYKRPLDSGILKNGDILTELFSAISGLKAGYTAVLADPAVTRASRVKPATTGGAIYSEDADSTMTIPFWNVDNFTRQMMNALIGRATGSGGAESVRMQVHDGESGMEVQRGEIKYTTSGVFIKDLKLTEESTRWIGDWVRENIGGGFRLITEVNWSGSQIVAVAPTALSMRATSRRQPTIGIRQQDLVDAVFNTVAEHEGWSENEFVERVRPVQMLVSFNKRSDQLTQGDYTGVIDRGLEKILNQDTENDGEQLFRGIKRFSGTSRAAEPIRLIVRDAAKRKRKGFENQLRRLLQRPEQFLSEVDWADIQERTGIEDGVERRVREALARYSRYIRAVDAIEQLGSAAGGFQSRLDKFSEASIKLLERAEKAANKEGRDFDYKSEATNGPEDRVARIPSGVLFAARRRRSDNLANPATDQGARDLVDSVDQQARELLDLAGIREWRHMNRDEVRRQTVVEEEGEERIWKLSAARVRKQLLDKMEVGRAFTDVDTYCAKKLINMYGIRSIQSGNPEELRATIALIEGYRDVGTEMARAFRQRFDPIETPRERRKRLMTEGILRPSARLQRKIAKARRDKDAELLKLLRDSIADENVKLLDHLTKLGFDLDNIEEYANDPRSTFQILRIAQTFKASNGDKAYEWYINALLSGVSTQVANVVGTVPLSIWEYAVKRPLEAVVSLPIRKGERVTFGEIKHMWGAFWPHMKKAARIALMAHDTEVPQLEVMLGRGVQGLQKYEIPTVSIKGRKGRFIRSGFTGLTGTRMLLAVDEFMKSVISGMEVNALAYREMVAKNVWKRAFDAALDIGSVGVQSEVPRGRARTQAEARQMADQAVSVAMAELIADTEGIKSDVWDRSMDMAHLLTFQTELGPIGQKAVALRDSAFVFKYIVPFAKTLINITKVGLFPSSPYSALGFAEMPKEIWDLYMKEDPKAKLGFRFVKPEERDWTKVSSRAIAQAGNFLAFMALYSLVDGDDDERPWVTGSKEVWSYRSRLTGMRAGTPPPLSFAVPVLRNGQIDKGPYVSFANVEPISTIFGFAIDAILAIKSGDPARMATDLPKSLSGQIFEKNLTRGVSDFFKVFEQPDIYGPKYLSQFVTAWIPGVYKRIARADRDYLPDRRVYGDGTDWLKMLGRRTIERTEIARHIFPNFVIDRPAWDIWGRHIPSDVNPAMQTKGMNWLYRAMMPFHTQYSEEFPMDVVIRKWNDEHNDPRDQVHFMPPRPTWKDRRGVEHYMTPEQLDQFQKLSGDIAREVAKMEMPFIDWSKPTSQQDADAVKSVVNDSRTLAKDTLSKVWIGRTTEADAYGELAGELHRKHIEKQAALLARPAPSRKALGVYKNKEDWELEVEKWEDNKRMAAEWLKNRGITKKQVFKAFPYRKGPQARLRLAGGLAKYGVKANRGTGEGAVAP